MENKKFKIATIEYKKFMAMPIEYKKVQKKFEYEPFIKIINFHNIASVEDLPKQYLNGVPRFYLAKDNSGNNYIHLFTKQHDYYLYVNSVCSKEKWEKEIVPSLLEAGKRLSRILLEEQWHGLYTLRI